MVLKNTFNIISGLEEAKRMINRIMLFSEEPMTIYNCSKLSDVISNLQAYSSSIQLQCINLVMEKKDLEKKILNPDPGSKTVE